MKMDTEQWRECEMWLMLPYLNDNASERKKRLLVASFCRNVSHLISKSRCRKLLKWAGRLSAFGDEPVPTRSDCLLRAIDECELCADGIIPIEDMAESSRIADRLSFVEEYYYACYDDSWGKKDFTLFAFSVASTAIHYATQPRIDIEAVHKYAAWAVHRATGSDEKKVDPVEEAAQCELVRDLFPDPSCSLKSQSKWPARPSWLSWNGGTVLKLAQTIYDDRAFDRLPVLADALEDAGCADPDILSHSRGPGPHVRGCWVVDLLLGKG